MDHLKFYGKVVSQTSSLFDTMYTFSADMDFALKTYNALISKSGKIEHMDGITIP